MSVYKVGYFVGSLSSTSTNRVLSRALIRLAPEDLEFTEIAIGDLPLYSPDFDPEYPPETILYGAPVRVRLELDLDPSHQDANFPHSEIRRRLAQIPHQPRDEVRTVVALERDLLVVDDDRSHREVPRIASAARCPLMTALSIVPGKPVSIQSPAR